MKRKRSFMPPKKNIINSKPIAPPTPQETPTETIRMRHIRFDDFDIYTAESEKFGKEKLLFHKLATKDLVIANTFKFLGSKENLWLCRDIHTGTIHIAPFDKFAQLDTVDSTK